ncbi:nicotinamide riboside transporter PnuC [Alteromonas sp. CYL-A6]|uniref:nicotinamide riboside transporter PnuC n=1 Tax=Alteromonas nitratireducens TaxID=3390813 RepID=UPI0034A7E680
MAELTSVFWSQIMATSLPEWAAVVLALAYVWLAAIENPWCWLCAFVSTALYTWLFWQVTLPFQSALNLFYMVMAVYGYFQWHGNTNTPSRRIVSWSWRRHGVIVPLALLLAWGVSGIAASQFSSDHLQLDASIHLLSMVTTFMVAHKVLENWLYWFFINLASVYLYWQTGLVLTACLFACYVVFSVYGFVRWRQQWKQDHGSEINHHAAQRQA